MEPQKQARRLQKPYPPIPRLIQLIRCEQTSRAHGRPIGEGLRIQSYTFLDGQGHAGTPKCLSAGGLLRRWMEPHGLSPWGSTKIPTYAPGRRSAPAFAKPVTAGVGRSVRRRQGFGGLSATGEIRRSNELQHIQG